MFDVLGDSIYGNIVARLKGLLNLLKQEVVRNFWYHNLEASFPFLLIRSNSNLEKTRITGFSQTTRFYAQYFRSRSRNLARNRVIVFILTTIPSEDLMSVQAVEGHRAIRQ